MARFFQAQPVEFVNDFMFEPNMELASLALAKRDGDIADQLDTLEIFRNLPIDFWKDADQENVAAIKDEYETRVDDITKQMQGDLMNTGNNRYLINQLRRDIDKDYESGRIRQIQDNAQAYRDFKTKLDAMPNPRDREEYMSMVDNYLSNAGGQGAFYNTFKPEEMYDRRDIWAEFTGSDAFKQLNPDEQASSIERVNGAWVVKQGNKTVELSQSKVGQAFQSFLNSAGLEGYGASKQKYSGEQWLDEQGNIRMDADSYLGNILATGIPSLSYKQTGTTEDRSINPIWQMQEQERQQIRAENRAAYRASQMAKTDMPPELSKNASFAAKTASNTIDIVNDKLAVLGKKYGVTLTTNDLTRLIDWGKKNKKGAFTQELINLQTTLNEGLRASYEPLYAMGFSKEYVETFKSNLQNGIVTKGDNIKGYVDLAGIGIPGVKSDKTNYLSPNELIGKSIGGRKVMNATILDKSSFPVFFGTSDLVNQVQSTIKLEFEPLKDAQGNYIETQESSVRYADFYQPSREITGDNTIKQDIINAN